MRIVLYLGKGGVGKTTVAAATALRCAELGYRTLVASTDIAHSLADSFDIPLQDKPIEIAPNLWAQEISVIADMHNYWGIIQDYVSGFVSGPGISNIVADELSAIPGMDEIVSLLHINKQAQEQNFDRVIIDAAPTGETIRLLTIPDTFRWYAGHLSRYETGVIKALKPFAGRMMKGPLELLNALEKLDEATAELRETLSNPEITSYRVVLQPEKMVIREAERAISYLGLFNYPVDSVIVNRILPDSADEGEFYRKRREIQARYLQMIEDNFRPLPIWRAPYYAEEVVGIKALSRLAIDCFGNEDPGQIFYTGKLQEILELENGGYRLRIPIPFVTGTNVRLRKRGDEMFITIGNFKREMILPMVLAKMKAVGGALRAGILEIDFVPLEQTEVTSVPAPG
jgi:arsenite/tail-anchored protein-transporting ATPase